MSKDMQIVNPAKLAEKMARRETPPKLILDWTEEIEKAIRILEFHESLGNMPSKAAIDRVVWMKLFKDTLYYEWIEGILDEDKTREALKQHGFFAE